VSTSLPLPKYHQIYLVLREQLQEGRFADGLPGELALAGQFGVARVTVRKALEQLSTEGLIDRAPGRGTRPRQTPATATAGGRARARACSSPACSRTSSPWACAPRCRW
jgi:GntR family transcriptional regulator